MPDRALRHAIGVAARAGRCLVSLNASNARQGIKTFPSFKTPPSALTVCLNASNARQGIKTEKRPAKTGRFPPHV